MNRTENDDRIKKNGIERENNKRYTSELIHMLFVFPHTYTHTSINIEIYLV